MMKIIADPDQTIMETPCSFDQLSGGDVFRDSTLTFEQAIAKQAFFIKLGGELTNLSIYNISRGMVERGEFVSVIVHQAKVVVLPN